MRSHLFILLSALLSISKASSPALGANLHGIRDLLGVGSGVSLAVNDDGSVIVGDAGEAFRWTSAGGTMGLGVLGGSPSYSAAQGVSGDGSVVVGWSFSASGQEAFRWTSAGGMIGLGDLPGGRFESAANQVSSDGAVAVGWSNSAGGSNYEAFLWKLGSGMVGLGDLPGGSFESRSFAANRDGSVVVGVGNSASGNEAFLWTSASGMVGLGDLPGGPFSSGAHDVSDDGLTVVGESNSSSGVEAFRWTADSGMVGLGLLPGGYFYESRALGVSADGSVVVGYSEFASPVAGGREAFYWTSGGGMRRLWDVMLDAGVNLAADGWSKLNTARGISADGSAIIGRGVHNGFEEDFVAYLRAVPEPSHLSLLSFALPSLLRRRVKRQERLALFGR